MGIQLGLPPEDLNTIVSQNISSLEVLIKEELSSLLKQTKPLPIYDLQFEELKQENFNPKLTGWKFFILNNNNVIASADIAVNTDGKDPEFLYFTTGDYIGQILSKISEIESLTNIGNDQFEVRLLRINSINLLSIWIHSTNQDLLYPLDGDTYSNAPYTFQKLFNESIKEQIDIIESAGSRIPSF